MAILVTGGAGYIGSHTCVELLNIGKEIIIVDNFLNSRDSHHSIIICKIHDITNSDRRIDRSGYNFSYYYNRSTKIF